MDKLKAGARGKGDKLLKLLAMMAAALRTSTKPLMVAMPVLVIVWCLGRLLENLHGNAVFDPGSTFWLGLVVSLLLTLWMAGLGLRCFETLKTTPTRKAVAAAWALFFAFAGIVLWGLEGFQVSAAGLLADVAGGSESSQHATFLLMKFHPANPMLAINLTVQAVTGTAWEVASLAPFVWSWNTLLAIFIWSFAFGIGLLMRPEKGLMKTLHLIFASCGLTALLVLKSKSVLSTDLMIVFQASVLMLLLLQVLLVYASLQRAAAEHLPKEPVEGSVSFGQTQNAQRTPHYRGLPPSAVALALALFLILPILADLKSQVKYSGYADQLAEKMPRVPPEMEKVFVAVAPLSIRSGPSLGDEILGVLPKGARISVQGIKYEWVNMGHNNWVPEKFLRPLIKEEQM